MGFVVESNFPNSRISSSLIAVDVVSGNPVAITGESVGLKRALTVQLAAGGAGVGANVNILEVGGASVGDYNFANAMVPKAFDSMVPTYAALTDKWEFYKGGLAGLKVATQTITYTDATKKVIQNIVTTYP